MPPSHPPISLKAPLLKGTKTSPTRPSHKISMVNRWQWYRQGETGVLCENLSHCHSVHYKHTMEWLGTELGPPPREWPATNRLSHGTSLMIEILPYYTQNSSPYRRENTIHCAGRQVLFIMRTTLNAHICITWVERTGVNVTAGGTYSYHCPLKGRRPVKKKKSAQLYTSESTAVSSSRQPAANYIKDTQTVLRMRLANRPPEWHDMTWQCFSSYKSKH